MNTLLTQGLLLKVGNKQVKYRIENIWIPSTSGIAREGSPVQDIPGRRIIHIFREDKIRFDGRVLEVLTEEECEQNTTTVNLPICPDHGTQMALNLTGSNICAVSGCRFGPDQLRNSP